MLFTLSARCQGSSHKKENKPLQDYCAATSDKLKTYAYALVADGHGGEKYIRSEKGAQIAVTVATECTNEILKKIIPLIRGKKNDLIEKNLKLLCEGNHHNFIPIPISINSGKSYSCSIY